MDNITQLKEKVREERLSKNYVNDGTSEENLDISEKYASTGESEFSREFTHPIDEVLSERHYVVNDNHFFDEQSTKGLHRSDAHIMAEARDVLMRSGDVDPSDIEVQVEEGHITLVGRVTTREMKKRAETIVEGVFGVIDVHNRLTISSFARPLVDNRTGLN